MTRKTFSFRISLHEMNVHWDPSNMMAVVLLFRICEYVMQNSFNLENCCIYVIAVKISIQLQYEAFIDLRAGMFIYAVNLIL